MKKSQLLKSYQSNKEIATFSNNFSRGNPKSQLCFFGSFYHCYEHINPLTDKERLLFISSVCVGFLIHEKVFQDFLSSKLIYRLLSEENPQNIFQLFFAEKNWRLFQMSSETCAAWGSDEKFGRWRKRFVRRINCHKSHDYWKPLLLGTPLFCPSSFIFKSNSV